MIKYLGTHNSGTGGNLVGWQKPFGFILNPLSQCQTLSIREQLEAGVKLFNLQITYYKGQWVFSHGLCIYKETLREALDMLEKYATETTPIYYQLYFDKNFFLGQNVEQFEKLVTNLLTYETYNTYNAKLILAWIEGSDSYLYKYPVPLDINEKYWTSYWAKLFGSWWDRIPNPKKHAQKYNKQYINDNISEYLMLDFIEYY